MGKKRNFEAVESPVQNLSVEVVIKDVTNHPFCLHGPTLLFSNNHGRYYACASCRNKKDCTLHIDEEDWVKENVRKRNEKYYSLIPKIDKLSAWKKLNEVKSEHASNRGYCDNCQELFVLNQTKKHIKDHKVISPITNEQLANPTTFLPPLDDDQHQAQYIFSKKSVSTILGILRNNQIRNILCIGTPSVHEAAQSSPEFESLLLDYDVRLHLFNPTTKFLWYNMFNNYLFNGNEDEKVLKKFLKSSRDTGLCIVMDPPFGGRVEPLVNTIKELSVEYNKITDKENLNLPVIWAFPYFAEPYICNMDPTIKMHDYQVEYENHKKFHNNKGGRKFGSPVRFFTNLPFNTIDLSNDSAFKFCDKCKFWVSLSNTHCAKCKACTSKNGMRYRHCNICKRCVKPTFRHCEKCNRCCLEKGHVCGTVVEVKSCYKCNERGHKQSECPVNKSNKRRK